ncbi:hypothetical protein BD309DRAFT_952680 [Dichomitus squalens]|nr:hypothetical protein BD309DRAFT_952680 [Dichomitus squalens]
MSYVHLQLPLSRSTPRRSPSKSSLSVPSTPPPPRRRQPLVAPPGQPQALRLRPRPAPPPRRVPPWGRTVLLASSLPAVSLPPPSLPSASCSLEHECI